MQLITVENVRACMNKSDHRLNPTHRKICLPIIERIYRKMKIGLRFPPIKINDTCICDGHHRYIASRLSCCEVEMMEWSMSRSTLMYDWKEVVLETTDWDTAGVIRHMDRRDALYNNVLEEEMRKLMEGM